VLFKALVALTSKPQGDKPQVTAPCGHHVGALGPVSRIFESDLNAVTQLAADSKARGYVLRMRGLPYSSTTADIERFFEGVQLSGPDAVLLTHTPDGRCAVRAHLCTCTKQPWALALYVSLQPQLLFAGPAH
jgi:hypothetical protein